MTTPEKATTKPRRGRGEGGLRQLANGKWAGRIDLGWTNGKRVRVDVYGRTKAEARTNMATKRLELAQLGAVPGGTPPTVEAWLNRWLDTIVDVKRKPNTARGYRWRVNTYLVPLLGNHRLDKLTPEHVRAAFAQMGQPCPLGPKKPGAKLGPKLCPCNPSHGQQEASLRQTFAVLRRALNVAVKDGNKGIARNVCEAVEAPSTKQNHREGLPMAEVNAVLRFADEGLLLNRRTGEPLKHALPASRYWAALVGGLRQGEALGMTWGGVDFDRRLVTVSESLSWNLDKSAQELGTPKSEHSNRAVHLPQPLWARLMVDWAAHVARYPEGDVDMGAFVWAAEDGGPMNPDRDYKLWVTLLKRAGVRHVALHAARNTAGDLLREAGADDKTVSDIFGHEDTKITGKYLGRNAAQERDALDGVGRRLFGHGAAEVATVSDACTDALHRYCQGFLAAGTDTVCGCVCHPAPALAVEA